MAAGALVSVGLKYVGSLVAEKAMEEGVKKLREKREGVAATPDAMADGGQQVVERGQIGVPQGTWDRTVGSAAGWVDPVGTSSGDGMAYTEMDEGQWVASEPGRMAVGKGTPAELKEMVKDLKAKGVDSVSIGGTPSFQSLAKGQLKDAGIEVVTNKAVATAGASMGL